MKRFRTVVFWSHLVVGVTAGLLILVMSVTGALLAFEPQILELVERDVRRVTLPASGAVRLGGRAILEAAVAARPLTPPTALSMESAPDAATAVSFGREGTVYVDPYTGRILGEGATRARAIFQSITEWHRWLAVSGEHRAIVRSAMDASNFLFLGLAISGLYLWMPRTWTRQRVLAILTFDRRAKGKARDFNWHNVIGFWCAPVLIVLTATAVVMSYPWANAVLYRLAGSPVPVARGPEGAPPRGPEGGPPRGPEGAGPGAARTRGQDARPPMFRIPANLDVLCAQAQKVMPTWGTMTVRLPNRPGAPVAFSMTDAAYWNAFARSQLTLDGTTGNVVNWEPYASSTAGQKARGWVRFGHTGELGGIVGQLLAGMASAGGAFLVWTGLSLAWRRLMAWRQSRNRVVAKAA